MKQLNITILLTMLMSIVVTTASAHDAEVDGIYYNLNTSSQTATVTYKGSSWQENEYSDGVVIPTSFTYKSVIYTVTSIGAFAFYACRDLTSITIPNSVTSIGEFAFNCCSLSSITIPNSITSIGNSAFELNDLSSIKVEEGNSYYDSRDNCNAIIETVSNRLIQGCCNTTIPNSVTCIGDGAFSNCHNLTTITIPNGVTSIENSAFLNCHNLSSPILIPNSVVSIGSSAFYNCSKLSYISIPNSVNSIGGNAFVGTAWFNNQPDGLVYAGRFAHNYKGTMPENTSITLQDGTLGICASAFVKCSGLTSITIPNSVTSIGDYAFSGCSGLTSITIPNSVTEIGRNTFYGCTGLTSITIPNSVTSIGYSAFQGCTGLTSITIPNSVTSIGDYAFSGCSGLTSITIPNSVTEIGYRTFEGCSGLTSITIPNSVTEIGYRTFEGCSGLTSITIPNSVTEIGYRTFEGCSSLNEVYNEATTPQNLSFNPYFNYTTATLHVPAGTKELYQAADYWKNFTNIVEMSIEPIVDETVIEFDDKDYIVDNTPVDLNNTVINDMYISMDNKSDVNNPDGFYDSTDKCIVINKATSASAIETAVASDLGSSDFTSNFTGMVIEVNGKGSIKINALTVGNNKLAVKIGSADAKTYTQATKGDVTINYDVTENTYVYIYAVDANNQQQSLSMDITDTSDNSVKVYSVTVTPDATAIETVTEATIPTAVFGKVYSIDGKQFSQPQKGLNILKMSDGTTRRVVK